MSCAFFLIACKMCFTNISMCLTMNGELCLMNCLLFSGVQGRIRPLVSADSWPKASLSKGGLKKKSCGKNGVCLIHQVFFRYILF